MIGSRTGTGRVRDPEVIRFISLIGLCRNGYEAFITLGAGKVRLSVLFIMYHYTERHFIVITSNITSVMTTVIEFLLHFRDLI